MRVGHSEISHNKFYSDVAPLRGDPRGCRGGREGDESLFKKFIVLKKGEGGLKFFAEVAFFFV